MPKLTLALALAFSSIGAYFFHLASAKSSLPWGLARAICTQNAAFELSGQIQSGLKDASKYIKLSTGNKHCKTIIWSQCESHLKNCQKFACPNGAPLKETQRILGRSLGDAQSNDDDDNSIPMKYRMTKIVHGHDAVPGEFPWMVTISLGFPRTGPPYTKYTHVCGATIINSTHVVSASHCFGRIPIPMYHIKFVWSRAKRVLIAGVMNITRFEEDSRQIINIKSFAKHPLFSTSTGEYDIAIAEAETPFVFNALVQPLRLSCPNSNPLQDKCLVMGWGRTDIEDHQHPDILQKAKIKVLKTQECLDIHNKNPGPFLITEHHICVTSPCSKPQGTCGGDSGGPLVCWDGSGPYIGGVTSWGSAGKCALPEHFEVFTRINSYFDFIRYNISMKHSK